jgi:aminoglycoside phosphotransferase (APT) family kinase protein
MPRMNDSVTLSYGEYYRASWPAFVENFGGALDPAQIAAGEAGGRHQEALLHALAGSHSTICHMDYKLDNLLFGDPRVAQAPLVVIDWQVPVRGRGACDVAYLLSQSMTVADRRESETTLLRLWHDRLRALGVEGYGFDQAELDYRRAVLRGLAVPVEMGGALDLGNERAVELVRTIVDRSFTAAVDCAATEGLL